MACNGKISRADLLNALRRCIAEKSLDEGQRLHSTLAANGLLKDDLVVSLLVQVYASCGSLDDAYALLVNSRCPLSWNTCITENAHQGQMQQARRLFDAMPSRNAASWNSLLAGYGGNAEIQQAKEAFEKLPQRSLVSWNAMVSVLARAGQLEEARSLFDAAPQRNVVSWNAMVSGYAQQGQGQQARLLFQMMASEGEKPNAITMICLLDSSAIWCSEFEDETLARDDVRVATSLVAAYAGKRQLKQAKHVFDSAANRDCAAWNALITGYADNDHDEEATAIFHKLPAWDMLTWAVTISAFARAGKAMEAMELYRKMLLEGLRPNTVCLLNVLAALDGSAFLQAGMEVECVYSSERTVATALVKMYGRCCSVRDAKRIFDSMLFRDVVAWNTMISAYAQNGHLQEAKDLLFIMDCRDIVSWNTVVGASGSSEEVWTLYFALLLDGCVPNRITYLHLLPVCSCVERGRRVQDELLQSGIHLDAALVSAIVAMYGRLGIAAEAWSLFCAAPQRDFLAWNAMCAAFAVTREGSSAVELFARMPQHCCAVSNTAMIAYVQMDRSTEALCVFSSMPWKDVASWTAMISAIASEGDELSVRLALMRMLQHGERPNRATFIGLLQSVDANVSASSHLELIVRLLMESGLDRDAAVGSALVTMHGRCRCLDLARAAFEAVPRQSVVAWTSLIAANAHCGDFVGSLDAFRRMDLDGVVADEVAITSACLGRSSLQEARLLHAAADEVGIVETSALVATAIISMHGDCGGVEDARKVFEQCMDRGIVLWTAMLSCYAVNGLSYEAVELFQTMECHGIVPDSVAFVSVLAACSHGGMLLQGTHYLSVMEDDYGVKVQEEHYACIVDLLARAGRLGDAEELLFNADGSTNSSVGWLSLLGASKIQGDAIKGLGAAAHVCRLRPRIPTPYLLLSNISTFHM